MKSGESAIPAQSFLPGMARAVRAAISRMRLGRPLRLLSSSQCREQRRIAREIIAGLDARRIQQIQAKHGTLLAGETPAKYLKMQSYLETAVSRAQNLKLDSAAPCRVLDIGCGNGYFLAVCQYFGHRGTGIDIPDDPLYAELIALLGVERILHRVTAFTPLPRLAEKVDVITAYMICFHNINEPSAWEAKEWIYFLDDCRSQLNHNGRIWLELNPGKRSDYRYMSDAAASELRLYPGAKLSVDKSVLVVQT